MRRRTIVLIAVTIILVATATGIFLLVQSSPALKIELNPLPPLTVKKGGNFSIEISVRNGGGFFKAEAEDIKGELQLPEGFIEESLQTKTRQLIFGAISPGDASHYGLTIIALNSIEEGEYHARLTVWGANVPEEASDIKIMILPP
jgi:uncharacterized membrane protein